MLDSTLPVSMWTVLANIHADLAAWADPKLPQTMAEWVKPDGGYLGRMYGTPKVMETEIFAEPDRWGSVMWCEVEYNHYGNRATYGIRSDGSVSCYMS
jgi:hypothetical protein